MLGTMKNIAGECIKHPQRMSVWSEREGKFICPEVLSAAASAGPGPAAVEIAAASMPVAAAPSAVAPVNPVFKLVFLTAAGGTLLFTLLCVMLHLATDGNPPPLMDKFIQGLFDLAKIGFGAIVGLLGGKALDTQARS